MVENGRAARRSSPKPKLLYSIEFKSGGWMACCEDQQYGPYSTFDEAFTSAMTEATAARRLGFHSIIAAGSQHITGELSLTRACNGLVPALPPSEPTIIVEPLSIRLVTI